MQRATLAGAHGGREFALEVSAETWDRFRDWRARRGGRNKQTGELLCEIADSRPKPTAELEESDILRYMEVADYLDARASGGEETQSPPNST